MKRLIILLLISLLAATSVSAAYNYTMAAEQDVKAGRLCAYWRQEVSQLKYPLPNWVPCPYACNMGTWVYRWFQKDIVCIGSRGYGFSSASASPNPTPQPKPPNPCTQNNQCCWGKGVCDW